MLDVLAEAGIVIPSREGRWPGGGGHNPGDLGEDLVQRGVREIPILPGEPAETYEMSSAKPRRVVRATRLFHILAKGQLP